MLRVQTMARVVIQVTGFIILQHLVFGPMQQMVCLEILFFPWKVPSLTQITI
jgi:hypothetical protein